MNEFAWAYTFMLTMILLEVGILKYVQGRDIRWREAISNLNSGHLVMLMFRGLEIYAFGLLFTYCSLHWVDQWPVIWQWIFGFIAWDFCFYWMHRLHHKIPVLWAVHYVHHQGEEFNLTLGVRNSWYSSLTNFPFIAWLAIVGLPLEIFIVVSSIHYTVQFYNHNAIVKKSGILDRLLITPANHRVHHGLDSRYVNKNFGGTFLWWDKLFGSFQAHEAHIDDRIGLKSGMPSYNPLLFNHRPLPVFVTRIFPGIKSWRTTDLPENFIGFCGILLFVISIYYVNLQGSTTSLIQWSFFSWVLLATFFIGGMSDKKLWGLVGWIAFCVLFPTYSLVFLHHSQWQLLICFSLLMVSALKGIAHLLQNRQRHEC
ncbi:MAG: fatty acid hydroxylase family protein [Gammaproteobacteria bacterium]|nr:MAG: fatty acid hydroxylase family protein [Gammaproteobacteria bacterium]